MSQQKLFKKYSVLGIEIDAVNMAETIDYLTHRAADPKAKSAYVTKPYVEFIDKAQGNKELSILLNNSLMCLPDGVALQWATAYLYNGKHTRWRALYLAASIVFLPNLIRKPLPEKFGGINFTWPLLRACRDQDLRVYLVGSPLNNDITHTARTIRQALPEIKVVGTSPGEIDGKKGDDLVRYLRKNPIPSDFLQPIIAAKPHIILVGMGFPLQEYVMARLADQLPRGIFVGEGGTFDYESFGGKVRRAPKFMQKTGLEWLWRLLLEPKRWRRQSAIPKFMRTVYEQSQPPKVPEAN
jgi:N-acetylglucosaminyldiphosphoundecaprenol N-acetyl-beta-D-mannosaminyltransferase